MNSNNIGRPKKYTIKEDEKELILTIIRDYNTNHNPYPTVKYKHIWEYSIELFHKGQFPFETSYDFWKRKGRVGRELVDIVNSIEHKKVYVSQSKNIDLIDIKDLLDKFGGTNKDILWDNLQPYNLHIDKFIEEINNLEMKNIKLERLSEQQEISIENLKKKNKKLQNLIFSLFIYSNKENELVNILNTGQSNSKLINIALESTFENPEEFYLELMEHIERTGVRRKTEQNQDLKVIPFNKDKNQKQKKPEYDL